MEKLAAARVRAAVSAARGQRTRASRVVDAVVVLAGLAYALWSARGQQAIWALLPAWWMPLDVAIGVAASLALWWRRRHPVLVAAVLAPIGGVFVAAAVGALVSVYTVASLRRAWIAVLLTVVHLAVAIPYYLVVPVAGFGLAIWAVLMVLLYATTLAVGLAVRARRQVITGLVASADAERREQEAQLQRARAAERGRIAREMHDVLAHRLSLLSVHAGALEHRTRTGGERPPDPAEVHEAATVIRTSAFVALEELREVLSLLGSTSDGELGTAAPQPGVGALDDLVAEAVAAGERIGLTVEGRDILEAARPQLQRTVYRVVQEGLTNARKHAPGARAEVTVEASTQTVLLRIENALPVGVAPSEMPGSGAGLTGLTERVRVEGGTLEGAVADGSFVLAAELPWRA